MSKIYILNDTKINGVDNIPLLKIEYIKQEVKIEDYEALIFTSKNAIYSLDSFCKNWKKIPSFAIAPKTAKIVEEMDGNLVFIGSSKNGNDFANEIFSELKNKKCLYVRAEKIASKLKNILEEKKINIHELITYKTVINNECNKKLEKNSTIIFSSPSTVKFFFEKYDWNDTLKAVVIGKTTAKYLPKDIKYFLSPAISLDECIKLARKL